jgi:hypothetical protein
LVPRSFSAVTKDEVDRVVKNVDHCGDDEDLPPLSNGLLDVTRKKNREVAIYSENSSLFLH